MDTNTHIYTCLHIYVHITQIVRTWSATVMKMMAKKMGLCVRPRKMLGLLKSSRALNLQVYHWVMMSRVDRSDWVQSNLDTTQRIGPHPLIHTDPNNHNYNRGTHSLKSWHMTKAVKMKVKCV